MYCSDVDHDDGPAIRALGSLFKLTQHSLWDDGSNDSREDYSAKQHNDSFHADNYIESGVVSTTAPDFSPSLEDLELISQMSELGLPLSFLTNKEKRSVGTKGKRKGTQVRNSDSRNDFGSEAMELVEVSVDEFASPPIFHDSNSSSLARGEVCYNGIAVDAGGSQCTFGEGEQSPSFSLITSNADAISGLYYRVQNSLKPCESEGIVSNNGNTADMSINLDGAHLSVTAARVEQEKKEHIATLIGNQCFKDSSKLQYDEETGNACNDFETESAFSNGSYEESLICKVSGQDTIKNSKCNGESGDWMVYWDDYYMRNYFYNIKTHGSTWFPPPGMEHLASGEVTSKLTRGTADVAQVDVGPTLKATDKCSVVDVTNSINESETFDVLMKLEELSEENEPLAKNIVSAMRVSTLSGSPWHCSEEINEHGSSDHVLENSGSFNQIMTRSVSEGSDLTLAADNWDVRECGKTKKKKKKARKRRLSRKQTCNFEEFEPQRIFEDGSVDIRKYWCQRYLLFSRFDDGIMMDEEGWFSVTPELIARHHALRCGSGVVIDCFTGVGGNAIQFAKISKHVIAIDIDPKKVDYACHNAAIYGVREHIDFLVGDSLHLTPKLKGDTVFLSPPWGGPDYANVKSYDINTMLKPRDGYFIFEMARKVASKVVMFLPRNVDINQLAEFAMSAQPPWSLEVEKNFLNGKLKAVTAYFTDNSERQPVSFNSL